MEIILGKTAGFCMGITNAVKKAQEEIEKNKGQTIYCIGELAHNPQVMQNLEQKGLKIIENLEEITNPKGKKVIFRAHGVEQKVYKKAEELELEIIDLTCPKVLAIHKIAQEYVKKGIKLFLIGEKKHPEVIGTASFCGTNYELIETKQDLKEALQRVKQEQTKELCIIVQTTFALEKLQEFVEEIEKEIGKNTKIEVKNTICQATKLRQQETTQIAQNVEYMIIIGGRKSSNTNKLYDIAKTYCKNTIMVEDESEFTTKKIADIKLCSKIGIMAGASTPQESIQCIMNKLEKS